MEFVSHFLLGLAMSYIGLLPPGMINMTSVRTTLAHGKRSALQFAMGAAAVVAAQAALALMFASYFAANPQIIDRLTLIGAVVLIALAGYFFYKGRQQFKGEGEERDSGFFLAGVGMSAINMLAIPFYLGWSTFMSMKGLLSMERQFILLFSIGAAVGAFLLCVTYIYSAKAMKSKIQFVARNINFILSALLFVLGVVALVKVF